MDWSATLTTHVMLNSFQHPSRRVCAEGYFRRWTLKQVQGDKIGGA